MNKKLTALAQITLNELHGVAFPTEEQIIEAMRVGVAKQANMAAQILSDDLKAEVFGKVISGMLWEKVHA